jgi:Spy/CpxP family protein refolding chaperone
MRRLDVKKLTVIVTVVSFVALAAVAYGQMGGHAMGSGMMGGPGAGCGMMSSGRMGGRTMEPEHQMWRHLAILNLDEQQKTSIGEIKSRMMKEAVRRMADMRIAHIELKELLAKDPMDMKAVEAKVKQSETLKTEMHLSHIKAMEEIKTKLTPEQKKKFRETIGAGPMAGGRGMRHCQECPVTKE